jgi:hypothetical protein
MATIVKTPSATWKAVIRKSGWPTTVKTFRTKRDAEDWSRRTEDEMVRGAFIQRATADRMTIQVALERYLKDVVPTKRASSQVADVKRSRILIQHWASIHSLLSPQRSLQSFETFAWQERIARTNAVNHSRERTTPSG